MAAVDLRICCALECEAPYAATRNKPMQMKRARNYPKRYIDPQRYEEGMIGQSCHARIYRLIKV
jgi:hypothetical protein